MGRWSGAERSGERLHVQVVFVLLALAGCAQLVTGQVQPPYVPYWPDNNGEYPRDMGGDGGEGGGGGGM